MEQIAGEKAGIIRPGVPVFYAQSAEESDRVIEKTAAQQGSSCKKSGKMRTKFLESKTNILLFLHECLLWNYHVETE